MTTDRSLALSLDAADELATLRMAFHIPRRDDGAACVYFCGHSLGLQPKGAARVVQEELDRWAKLAVAGHFESSRPWLSYHELLTPALARLAGAQSQEVVAMNSLTVNLHLLLASFYRPSGVRRKILIEKRAFSSDRYAVASHIRQRGLDSAATLIEIGASAHALLNTAEICDAIERDGAHIATVMLPGVQYLSGQLLDMQTIAACAHRHGCSVGFDLAHAIGNVPLRLHDWNVDFAVWCGYKYLNGGPGALGGCFVHERHGRSFDLPRLAGWWGHDKATRFAMPEEFAPLAGAEGWQISNPPILAGAPLLASLELFDRAGMDALRAKSVRLTEYLESLLRARLQDHLEILTPADQRARGSQLSVRLRCAAGRARAIHNDLTERGFVSDWREPDIIRIAPVPMYNTFVEAWDFVEGLHRALTTGA
jgi:kynureninase